jgi:hypothetical protein
MNGGRKFHYFLVSNAFLPSTLSSSDQMEGIPFSRNITDESKMQPFDMWHIRKFAIPAGTAAGFKLTGSADVHYHNELSFLVIPFEGGIWNLPPGANGREVALPGEALVIPKGIQHGECPDGKSVVALSYSGRRMADGLPAGVFKIPSFDSNRLTGHRNDPLKFVIVKPGQSFQTEQNERDVVVYSGKGLIADSRSAQPKWYEIGKGDYRFLKVGEGVKFHNNSDSDIKVLVRADDYVEIKPISVEDDYNVVK